MSISPVAVAREEVQRDLWARTAVVAGRLNRAQAELVDIAAELIEGGHWGDGGFRSPNHYLVVRAGLSPAHATDIVTLARRRAELPDATRDLRAAGLSLDQAAVVAHHVPTSHQGSATQLARHSTVPQLRRALSRHAFQDPSATGHGGPDDEPKGSAGSGSETASERRACARPELSTCYDRDGRFQLRYSAPATIGALVEQALKEAKDALFLRHTKGEATTSAAGTRFADAAQGNDAQNQEARHLPTYADALEEIANRALSTVTSTSRAKHYRVYLHLSTDGAWINGGGAIPRRLLNRFLTDGILQPVWETEGRPVSVGRKMRILPARSRRLIEDRDRGCRFPGCTATRFVEIHHLDEWAKGGATDDDNQISLCPFHHDGIDRGDHLITGDPTRPDGLVVVNRYGVPVQPPSAAELASPPGGDPPIARDVYQPPTGETARWADIEVPPDSDLPAREHRALRLVTTSAGHLKSEDSTRQDVATQGAGDDRPARSWLDPDPDDPEQDLVFDSYRRSRAWRITV